MPDHSLIRDLIIVFALALVFIVGLARLKMPPLVGFILAGAVAGPTGLAIIRTQEEVDLMAELGIVLLLFTVGLDFSIADLRRVWKAILASGVLQMGLTAAVVLGTLVAAGLSGRLGLFIGLFVALSSTAIVLKELGERNQLDSPHGRLMVGVLLLQDLAIVVLLLLVPTLSGATEASAVPGVLLRATIALGVVAILGRLVLHPLFRIVTSSGRREAFPLAVILASIGTAWVASLLGLSMALGAFLAGLVLAGSEFSHQAHAEVRPLRDILAGLFFISLGMLVDLTFLVEHLPIILGVAFSVVFVKALAATGALLLSASPMRIAVTAAVGLAQVGEFSFILGRAGVDADLLSPMLWQTLLAASILTMVATPGLVAVAPMAGSWIASRFKRAAGIVAAPTGMPHLSHHVVVLGFGIGGQLFGRVLRELKIPYLILELNGDTVRRMKAAGEPIYYGDATSPDAMHAAGVDRASAVVLVMSDSNASLRAVEAIRAISPHVPLIVRSRYREEARALSQAGATLAVAEELEASLEVLAQLLARLDVPGNLVETLVDRFRRDSAGARTSKAPFTEFAALPDAISRVPIASHRISDGDWSIGRTLADVNLRAETGATVVAVKSGDRYVTSPSADLAMHAGDTLYLLGDESDVMLARKRLTSG